MEKSSKIITQDNITVGQQIKMAMNEKGESIKSLAEKTGLSSTIIHNSLHERNLTLDSLKKIAKQLEAKIIVQ